MKTLLALILVLALGTSASAAGIVKGAMMHVKPNSVWFEKDAQLTRWQALKKAANKGALVTYEQEVLGAREAWRFTGKLTVKVLAVMLSKNQVNVELTTPGRMAGTTWFLDRSRLVK